MQANQKLTDEYGYEFTGQSAPKLLAEQPKTWAALLNELSDFDQGKVLQYWRMPAIAFFAVNAR